MTSDDTKPPFAAKTLYENFDGCAPSEEEIKLCMSGRLHSRKSASDMRHPVTRKERPISDTGFTTEWVLGRYQKAIPF